MKLELSDGKTWMAIAPLPEVPEGMAPLLKVLGPILSSAMGPLGQNMNFFVLDDRKKGGRLHPVDFLEERYQGLVGKYYETGKSPLPCTALSSSCFIDPYWNLYPCSIWDEKIGNLRENGFDLQAMWDGARRKELREDVINENCSHCWTPCEAYPTILGNLTKAVLSTASKEKAPLPVGTK